MNDYQKQADKAWRQHEARFNAEMARVFGKIREQMDDPANLALVDQIISHHIKQIRRAML